MLSMNIHRGNRDMQQLVGKVFSIGNGQYRVVDVRQLSGESMVYAETMDATDSALPASRPRRAAFHYSDIANLFGGSSNNKIA